MMTSMNEMMSWGAEMQSFADCDAFSSELSRCHFKWNFDPVHSDHYHAHLRLREFGSSIFADVAHDPLKGERRPTDINTADGGLIVLTLFTKGSAIFSRGGNDLKLNSSDLFLVDGAAPSYIQTDEELHCKTILFPRELATQRIANLEDLIGQRVGLESGLGQLLYAHIEALHRTIALVEPTDRASVLGATLEVVAACFKTEAASGSEYRRSLRQRIEYHMREHLLDTSLTPANVARHFGFSPRQLHRLFAESGLTFSEWVRREKLCRAEKALTSRSASVESITQIAHRLGFCDAAHFSNLFKSRYGMPPREYRLAAREGRLH